MLKVCIVLTAIELIDNSKSIRQVVSEKISQLTAEISIKDTEEGIQLLSNRPSMWESSVLLFTGFAR